MERSDFHSIFRIISNHLKTSSGLTQYTLTELLFRHFLDSECVVLDAGLVNRWVKGSRPVSTDLISFYAADGNDDYLYGDIEESLLPQINDVDAAVSKLYSLVIQDSEISQNQKSALTDGFPFADEYDKGCFIGRLLLFAMERKFVPRDEQQFVAQGNHSPVLNGYVIGCEPPKPCKYFCGRDMEFDSFHKLLKNESKLFICGIAGIGKSEFIKAYAARYKHEYTNILFIRHSASLFDTIAKISFSTDIITETKEQRFEQHLRLLKTLKDDTLLIIDGFNATVSDDELLGELLEIRCNIVFTTRSNIEEATSYELKEISEETLLSLYGCFYKNTMDNEAVVREIIRAVHSHTLAVDMSAKLLQHGSISAHQLPEKLIAGNGNPNASDKININKDSIYSKDTYFGHIRTLFALFLLESDEKYVMSCLSFFPCDGIRAKYFAQLVDISNLNTVNLLVEKGFIAESDDPFSKIFLHPMIKAIVIADLKPSVVNCHKFLNKLHVRILDHGHTFENTEIFSKIATEILRVIVVDDKAYYQRFLQDMYSIADNFKDNILLASILSKLEEKKTTENDKSLLCQFKSLYSMSSNSNYELALKYAQKAVEICIEEDNPQLAANNHALLSSLYCYFEDYDKALSEIKKAIDIRRIHGIVDHDTFVLEMNYAHILGELGHYDEAISLTMLCAAMIKHELSENCIDYANCCLEIGLWSFALSGIEQGSAFLTKAFGIYKQLAPAELYAEKVNYLLSFDIAERIPNIILSVITEKE